VTAGDITINSSIRQYFNTRTEHSFYLGKMYVTLSNKDVLGLQWKSVVWAYKEWEWSVPLAMTTTHKYLLCLVTNPFPTDKTPGSNWLWYKRTRYVTKKLSATQNRTFTDGKVRAQVMSLSVLKEIIQNYFTMWGCEKLMASSQSCNASRQLLRIRRVSSTVLEFDKCDSKAHIGYALDSSSAENAA